MFFATCAAERSVCKRTNKKMKAAKIKIIPNKR